MHRMRHACHMDGGESTRGIDSVRFPPEAQTSHFVLWLSLRKERTTNGLERLNREIRRRTRVASLFPNEASCLRLVTAVVMEISEDWQTGKRYIKWESDNE